MNLTIQATLVALAGLALVDSTSFGTLGVPAAMLVQPRVRPRVILGYLLTILAFYWALGLALLWGADGLRGLHESAEGNRTLDWVLLVTGVGPFAFSFRFDGSAATRRHAEREASGRSSVQRRWLQRAIGPEARYRTVAALALVAGLVEAASMLPYLAAIGLLSSTSLPLLSQAALLGGYGAVMVLPALVLLVGRLTLARQVEPVLTRLNAWLTKHSGSMLGWLLGIVGFLLASDAAQRLIA